MAAATATTTTVTPAAPLPPTTPSSSGGALSSLGKLVSVVGVLFAVFVIIFWVALVFWTWRDVRSGTQDTLLQITATLLVAVFGLCGLFIYLIGRPRQTLEVLYEA